MYSHRQEWKLGWRKRQNDMADENGGRVTTSQFYQAQLDTNREIAKLHVDTKDWIAESERRIVESVTSHMSKEVDKLTNRQDGQDERIHDLELSDKKWGSASMIVGAILAGLAALVGINK